MPRSIDLPSYLEQEPEVAERFKRIYRRPVVMDVQRLGKRFGGRSGPVQALEEVSFKIHRREFITIIGQSGCGKSTLIRILAGLDYPTAGAVLVDGKPVDGAGPDRGMVFQGYTLFPWLTVKRNVMFGLRRKGLSAAKADAEARQWVEMVGLTPFLESYPHQLSGGMKQRVAIARALANQPRVLLMDEPFGASRCPDPRQMQEYLRQIWMNVDVTIMFITHDLDEAIYLADRIVVLGRIPAIFRKLLKCRWRSPEPRTPCAISNSRRRDCALMN